MLNLGCRSQGKGPGMSQRGGVQGGPSELLGTPRRFLGARGLLPRNSSELLGGSSEVPRRKPQRAQAGHPQAVAGEQIFKKVVNPLANIDFHEKL